MSLNITWKIYAQQFEAAVESLSVAYAIPKEWVRTVLYMSCRDMLVGELDTAIFEPEIIYGKLRDRFKAEKKL